MESGQINASQAWRCVAEINVEITKIINFLYDDNIFFIKPYTRDNVISC